MHNNLGEGTPKNFTHYFHILEYAPKSRFILSMTLFISWLLAMDPWSRSTIWVWNYWELIFFLRFLLANYIQRTKYELETFPQQLIFRQSQWLMLCKPCRIYITRNTQTAGKENLSDCRCLLSFQQKELCALDVTIFSTYSLTDSE